MTAMADAPPDPQLTVAELEAALNELAAMLMLSRQDAVRQELQKMQARFESELALAKAPAPTPAVDAAPPLATAPAETKAPADPAAKDATGAKDARDAKDAKDTTGATAVGPWTEITVFSLDLGDGDKPFVTVDVRLRGVEALPSKAISCDFTESSLDLKVLGPPPKPRPQTPNPKPQTPNPKPQTPNPKPQTPNPKP